MINHGTWLRRTSMTDRKLPFSLQLPQYKDFQQLRTLPLYENKDALNISLNSSSSKWHYKGSRLGRTILIFIVKKHFSDCSDSRNTTKSYVCVCARTFSRARLEIWQEKVLTWIIRRLETLSGVLACTADADSKKESKANRKDGMLMLFTSEVVFVSDFLTCISRVTEEFLGLDGNCE